MVMVLDEDQLYSAGMIARMAREQGLLKGYQDPDEPVEEAVLQQRIRIALGAFTRYRDFPREGDGMIVLPGQPAVPGWFGWRWQNHMDGSDLAGF